MTDQSYADLRAALDDGSLTLNHVAVAEDSGLRWMSGRKLPAGVPSIELHGIKGGARVHGHIAANPDTIRALLADHDRLREALRWAAAVLNDAAGSPYSIDEDGKYTIDGETRTVEEILDAADAALAQEGS